MCKDLYKNEDKSIFIYLFIYLFLLINGLKPIYILKRKLYLYKNIYYKIKILEYHNHTILNNLTPVQNYKNNI